MSEETIELVPACDGDYEFSCHVKKAAYGALIRKVFGWDETLQRDFHRNEWMERRPSIIKFGETTIGTMAIAEGCGHIEIGQFFILPEYQNRGIGSYLLHGILLTADMKSIIVRLAFLRGNRAEALYRRNAFQLVRQTETYCYMERKAQGICQQGAERNGTKQRRALVLSVKLCNYKENSFWKHI